MVAELQRLCHLRSAPRQQGKAADKEFDMMVSCISKKNERAMRVCERGNWDLAIRMQGAGRRGEKLQQQRAAAVFEGGYRLYLSEVNRPTPALIHLRSSTEVGSSTIIMKLVEWPVVSSVPLRLSVL